MRVTIECPFPDSNTRGPLVEDEILFWILKRLPASVPKLQSGIVYIYLDFPFMPMFRTEEDMSKKAITFYSTLFDKAKEIDISITSAKFDNCSNLLSRSFQGMTGLTFDCRANSDILYSIIKKTRHTLETLDVCLFDSMDMELLFYDDDNQAITYPRLYMLRFNSYTVVVPDEMNMTDESVAPFPALTSLVWSPGYPFSDDTLFSGNSETLRYMDIELDEGLVNVLEKYKVFSEGKYPNLHYQTTYISYGTDEDDLDPEPSARHAMSLLSPAVRVFSLENDKLPLLFAPYIACSSSFAENIQVLDLSNAEMNFDDMLEVIGLLPNLTDICCLSRESLLDINKDLEEEIGYYQKEFYPLSHRLKSWSFADTDYTPIKAIALKAAILAILCTNFTFTAVQFEKRHYYHYMLKRILKQPGLSKYAEKINPLFRYE